MPFAAPVAQSTFESHESADPDRVAHEAFQERWRRAKVYQKFYDEFEEGTQRSGVLMPGSGLLRVLHINRASEGGQSTRSVHLGVSEMPGNEPAYDGRLKFRDQSGGYMYMNYRPEAFRVQTATGNGVMEWEIVRAYGIHRGDINAIDGRYNPGTETLHIGLVAPERGGRMTWLRVARLDGSGTMDFPGMQGWILDVADSHAEQKAVLAPLEALPVQLEALGRTA